ncbi:hypothetical protein Tco_1135390 [Tanacetum coccineum]
MLLVEGSCSAERLVQSCKTTSGGSVTSVMPITSAEDKAQRRLEDAKLLLEAIEKRFGRNEATKKTQRNILKHQYENFTAPSSKMLDQTFDRLQKLVSQLELLGEKLSQEDVNQKLLRRMSPEWNTHAVVWRNKSDLDTMSMDDLYNNLKVYEPEVQAHRTWLLCPLLITTLAALMKQLIDGLRWQMDYVDLRARRFWKNKEGCLCNACRALRNQDNKKESSRRSVHVEISTSTTLVSCDGLGGYDWSDQAEEGPNYALMTYSSSSSDTKDKFENASKSLDKLIECQIVDNCKKGLGYQKYNAVPPPYTGNFMPPTPDLSFTGLDEFVNKPVVENRKSDEEVYKVVRKSDDAPTIEEWVSDSEEENVSRPKTEKKTVKPSIAKIKCVKPKQQEKMLGNC